MSATPADSAADASGDLSTLGAIGFVGAGAVGSMLARALAARGAHITAIAARQIAHAAALVALLPEGMAQALPAEAVVTSCDLVFLAVPDDAITPLAEMLPWRSGQRVVHLSGAKPARALTAAQARGAQIAALHPLMTFPRAALDGPVASLLKRLSGCYWALEAEDRELAQSLTGMVTALDGHVLRLGAEDRVPYHLAGVFTSNYVVTLLATASALWETFGVARGEALQALLPLLRATVENLAERGLPQALSGPVARGDTSTVAAHLAWLDGAVQGAQGQTQADTARARDELYRLLARLTIPLALEKQTITPEQAAALRDLLGK